MLLLVGGSTGPLASAAANDVPDSALPLPADGAVLPPVEQPPSADGPVESPAVDPGAGAPEQPAELPPDVGVEPDDSGTEPAEPGDPGAEPPTDEPVQGEGNRTGNPEDPSVDPDLPPGDDTGEDSVPPSGGSKGDDPDAGDEPGVLEPLPDPSALPQVLLPDDTGAEPGETAPPSGGDTGPANAILGSGIGTLDNSPRSFGNPPAPSKEAAFAVASSTGDGVVREGGSGVLPEGTQLAALPSSGEEGTAGENSGAGSVGDEDNDGGTASGDEGSNVVTKTVDRLVEVVPDELKAALAALAALSVMLGVGYVLAAMRARRLARQRRELLQEVGLLQTALLPPVPDKVGQLLTSVAYRPADGPGAGGDFYDVLPLSGGRVGFILGDVSGHGRGALARTAFMRYTLRAYLEAGLEPRAALQVAGRVIDDNLGGDFATVLLAVHDPETGSLTYASAGHPSPIVVGPEEHEPITAASSPPIGVGVRTGLRQTTVPLPPGAVAAMFTDGLIEARTADGILGRERLTELLSEIGDEATARRLIERVSGEANVMSDDMAAVVVTPTAGATAGLFRTEQLELSTRELEGPIARRFLEACGLSAQEVDDAERDARLLAERFGGVVLHVVFGNRLRVEVLPRNVESIEAASRRVSAGSSQ